MCLLHVVSWVMEHHEERTIGFEPRDELSEPLFEFRALDVLAVPKLEILVPFQP
jgi:hypothetical protein